MMSMTFVLSYFPIMGKKQIKRDVKFGLNIFCPASKMSLVRQELESELSNASEKFIIHSQKYLVLLYYK